MRLYSTYPDDRLTAQLRRGDEKAFTEIYERYWEKLFAIAYHFAKSKETAEEIVQEIFLRLWDRRGDVLIADLGAYLATACKFAVFKQLVRQQKRRQLLHEYLAPVSVADDTAAIEARFLEEYIHGIVETLSDQCRVVYELRRNDNLPVEEIARILRISPNTARNHLNKALKTIRLSLREAQGCFTLFH
jgi:RNA polymerase sigma-70 factor (family 1)